MYLEKECPTREEKLSKFEYKSVNEYTKPSVICIKYLKDDIPPSKGKVNAVLSGAASGAAAAAVAAAMIMKGYY